MYVQRKCIHLFLEDNTLKQLIKYCLSHDHAKLASFIIISQPDLSAVECKLQRKLLSCAGVKVPLTAHVWIVGNLIILVLDKFNASDVLQSLLVAHHHMEEFFISILW